MTKQLKTVSFLCLAVFSNTAFAQWKVNTKAEALPFVNCGLIRNKSVYQQIDTQPKDTSRVYGCILLANTTTNVYARVTHRDAEGKLDSINFGDKNKPVRLLDDEHLVIVIDLQQEPHLINKESTFEFMTEQSNTPFFKKTFKVTR